MRLDTIINYLTDDALLITKDYDSRLQNIFFEYNQKFIDDLHKKLERIPYKKTIKMSPDPRSSYRIPAEIASGVLIGVLSMNLFSFLFLDFVLGLASGAAMYKEVSKKTAPLALRTLKKDVDSYLSEAKKIILQDLNKVVVEYRESFYTFLLENDDFNRINLDNRQTTNYS